MTTPILPDATPKAKAMANSLCLFWAERAEAHDRFDGATRGITNAYHAAYEAAQRLSESRRRAAASEAREAFVTAMRLHREALAVEIGECERRREERFAEIEAAHSSAATHGAWAGARTT